MNVSYWIIFFGIALVIFGLLNLFGVPFGKMPGDIQIKSEKTEIYFPIVTSLIISVVLTILLNAFFWFRK